MIAYAATLFEVPTNTVSNFTASVTDTLGDTGFLAIMVFSIALPLVFFVAHSLVGLMPSRERGLKSLERDIGQLNRRIKSEKRFLQEASSFTSGFGKIGK